MVKNFILNADDFGMSNEFNRAVLEGFNNGILTSASLCANGNAFDSAVNDILPDCPQLGIGVHLNIIEGKALTKCPALTDSTGHFNKGYLFYILNSNNKNVLEQIENEFRAQIEKIKKISQIDHIDSHVHTHAIPSLFDITCKLALEYNIPYVRTQYEKFYIVPEFKRHLNFSYLLNIIKVLLLKLFTIRNRKKLGCIQTNDFLIGVGYTGMMDSTTIEYGLKSIVLDNCNVEALIHPNYYSNDVTVTNARTNEFALTCDDRLKNQIYRLGFNLTNYKKLLK